MSSANVRTAIISFLESNSSEDFVDLSAKSLELSQVLADEGIQPGAPWVGVEFIADVEEPITIPATNTTGKYRELGAIYFHVVNIAKLTSAAEIIPRAEDLRNLMRGQRIGSIIIESVAPVNFQDGATLNFEGGYTSGSFIASYQYDFDL